jgi:PAS domain S-box-containing protein
MQFQSNPYLIWLAIPGLITLGIGLYIQTRPIRKRESNVLAISMFACALWSFANAIQLLSPDMTWQIVWHRILYLGVMSVPTAFFLLSVKLTGFLRQQVERVEKVLWVIPGLLFLVMLTNPLHKAFFSGVAMRYTGGFAELINRFGPLFYVHTAYSYLLLMSGVFILIYSIIKDSRHYGIQGFALILGVVAPLAGNAYYLFGSPPPGFPDPTPIMFTITGLIFTWTIFTGGLLEVVPLAHDSLVHELANGILILGADKTIREINPAASALLGLSSNPVPGVSLVETLMGEEQALLSLLGMLDGSPHHEVRLRLKSNQRALDVSIKRIDDWRGELAGWLLQLSDVSQRVRLESSLANTRSAYENLLDTIQDVYFEADKNGSMVFVNQAF